MSESAAPWRALEDAPAGEESSDTRAGEGRRPAGWLVAALAVAAILVLAAVWLAATSNRGVVAVDGASAEVDGAVPTGDASSRPASIGSNRAEVVVDVQGAVVNPGVIRLPTGSRVGDAIAAAGGFGPRVAAARVGRELNLAALIRDGDQIVVPSRDDPASGATTAAGGGSGGSGARGSASPVGPLDLNRASASELDGLPGIGPVTAAKIVAAREERPFASVDELRSRKVVGAAAFAKIKDLLVVR